MEKKQKRLAIVNNHDILLNALTKHFEYEGYTTFTLDLNKLESGDEDIDRFIEENEPEVFLWDIAKPYEKNWQFLEEVAKKREMEGRRIVVTTTDMGRLKDFVGPILIHEVILYPDMVDEISEAVREEFDKLSTNKEGRVGRGKER